MRSSWKHNNAPCSHTAPPPPPVAPAMERAGAQSADGGSAMVPHPLIRWISPSTSGCRNFGGQVDFNLTSPIATPPTTKPTHIQLARARAWGSMRSLARVTSPDIVASGDRGGRVPGGAGGLKCEPQTQGPFSCVIWWVRSICVPRCSHPPSTCGRAGMGRTWGERGAAL